MAQEQWSAGSKIRLGHPAPGRWVIPRPDDISAVATAYPEKTA